MAVVTGARREGVLCFATKGAGTNDEQRILALLADHHPRLFAFDRARKASNVRALLREVHRTPPELLVMEGTGLAGGISLLLCSLVLKTPYVVSTGDAVGPFIGSARPLLAGPGWLYEWSLYRRSVGVIGWTPYLVGRALTMGAPGGVTAAGFALRPAVARSREAVRAEFGIPPGMLVVGIAGSLAWNAAKGYCYGWDLVQAIRRTDREGIGVLVVGEGDGLERLRRAAGGDLGRRIFLPGAVDLADVTAVLGAMDVGSLPQSGDQVGSFRYSTKITEYHAARLPFLTGRLPLAYDVAEPWCWRLPGTAPWGDRYITAVAAFLEGVDPDAVAERRAQIPDDVPAFDADDQRRRVGAFVADLRDMLRRR